MVFELNGSELTAWLYAEGTTPGVYDDLLGSVTTTDTTYTKGSAGLRSSLGGYNRESFFDDFVVSEIPEPASFMLMGLATMLLAKRSK